MTNDDVTELRCDHCHDVIGVYEPLVVADDAKHEVTSLVNRPWLQTAQPACYHRGCYEQLAGCRAER